VRALLKLFPNAKFIYIQRHPYDVFNSSLHLRYTMIEENTLGDAYHPHAEESVIDTYVEAWQAYQRDKSLIPSGNLCEVVYEKLAADPMGELEKIYQSLGLPNFDEVRRRLAPQLDEHRQYKKNKFTPDSHWQQEMYNRCREIYERYGYPPPGGSGETAASTVDGAPLACHDTSASVASGAS
jgi:hypothetical protein